MSKVNKPCKHPALKRVRHEGPIGQGVVKVVQTCNVCGRRRYYLRDTVKRVQGDFSAWSYDPGSII